MTSRHDHAEWNEWSEWPDARLLVPGTPVIVTRLASALVPHDGSGGLSGAVQTGRLILPEDVPLSGYVTRSETQGRGVHQIACVRLAGSDSHVTLYRGYDIIALIDTPS